MIAPFQIARHRQRFVLRSELRIDLSRLEPDIYRVLAVQNFWVEDRNPDLRECIAGIFLARRRADGLWEEPENWPIECRTLALLAHLDTREIAPLARPVP